MKQSMILKWVIVGFLAMAGSAKAQITLFDNITNFATGANVGESITTTVSQAQAFQTDGNSYTLSTATLRLIMEGSNATLNVGLYSNTGTGTSKVPSTLIATLTSPGAIATGSYANYAFTAPANTTLSANTVYWIVATSDATFGPPNFANFRWNRAANGSGSGAGFITDNAIAFPSNWSNNQGRNPLAMTIVAESSGGGQAVPELSTFVLSGLGMGAAGYFSRRKKKATTA